MWLFPAFTGEKRLFCYCDMEVLAGLGGLVGRDGDDLAGSDSVKAGSVERRVLVLEDGVVFPADPTVDDDSVGVIDLPVIDVLEGGLELQALPCFDLYGIDVYEAVIAVTDTPHIDLALGEIHVDNVKSGLVGSVDFTMDGAEDCAFGLFVEAGGRADMEDALLESLGVFMGVAMEDESDLVGVHAHKFEDAAHVAEVTAACRLVESLMEKNNGLPAFRKGLEAFLAPFGRCAGILHPDCVPLDDILVGCGIGVEDYVAELGGFVVDIIVAGEAVAADEGRAFGEAHYLLVCVGFGVSEARVVGIDCARRYVVVAADSIKVGAMGSRDIDILGEELDAAVKVFLVRAAVERHREVAAEDDLFDRECGKDVVYSRGSHAGLGLFGVGVTEIDELVAVFREGFLYLVEFGGVGRFRDHRSLGGACGYRETCGD